jgi:hypothetical protein
MTVPEVVECSGCGQIRKTNRGNLVTHSSYATGPECDRSRQPVTREEIEATRNVTRGRTVLNLAHIMRDEDPRRVHQYVRQIPREELEALLCVALTAIPADTTMARAFGWTNPTGGAA